MQKNDSISDEQLSEIIEAVFKALSVEKISLPHHPLSLGDYATGDIVAD